MTSPWDLVKVAGFRRGVCIGVVVDDAVVVGGFTGGGGGGGGCQVIVVHLVLVDDAGFSRGLVGVHLAVCPLRVAQESGFQRRVQGKEGLDQRGLRL